MKSIAEKLRERLGVQSNGQTRHSSSDRINRGGSSASSSYDFIQIGGAGDRESATAGLRIACAIYLRATEQCYINYQSAGIAVFEILIGEGSKWLKGYCLDPYPDMCCCGHEILSNHGGIRDHCTVCHGKNRKLGYDRQQLASKLDLHPSWLDYGFAYALKQVGGKNNGY
jgi:hypothetical protein